MTERTRYKDLNEFLPFLLPPLSLSLPLSFSSSLSQDGHPEQLQCGLEFGGRLFILELEKNHPGLVLVYSWFSPCLNSVFPVFQTHCFYHGRVRGLPHSRAALSTCSGLRSVSAPVHLGKTLLLLPVCDSVSKGQIESHIGSSLYDCCCQTKYIELVLVVDHQESQSLCQFYRPLNVRVALTGLEIWSDTDKIHIEKNPTETLHNFLQWRSRDLLPRIRHDNAQLIMGGSFDGTTVGMASQSSMCSRDRSGGVNDHLVSVLGVASTVAHELGHNLGMSHDSAERRCQCHSEGRNHGCIMEPSTGFSSCSLEDLSSSLLHGGGMCLFNVPRPESLLGGPRCGNLYLEPGEECDCGLIQECSDPCCNASTCRLVSGAQCSSDGVCCSDCQVRIGCTNQREVVTVLVQGSRIVKNLKES
uniref:Uncharacterized protein n=1 Tax=Periophthalmus magnuspinnatus TaxID=409849 RepID=A0A3B3Z9A4_9GOBI